MAASLPDELLARILSPVDSIKSLVQARAVCKSWRSAVESDQLHALRAAQTTAEPLIALTGGGICGRGYRDNVLTSKLSFKFGRDGAWFAGPPMPESRIQHGVVQVGRKIYVVGGLTLETGLDPVKRTLVYDIWTATWSDAPGMRHPRKHAAVVALPDGRILVAGGMDHFEQLRSCEIFDPKTEIWTAVAPLAEKRWFGAGAVLDGRAHVAGGRSTHSGGSRTMEIYDAAADRWNFGPPCIGGLERGCAVASAEGELHRFADRGCWTYTPSPVEPTVLRRVEIAGLSDCAIGDVVDVDGTRGRIIGFHRDWKKNPHRTRPGLPDDSEDDGVSAVDVLVTDNDASTATWLGTWWRGGYLRYTAAHSTCAAVGGEILLFGGDSMLHCFGDLDYHVGKASVKGMVDRITEMFYEESIDHVYAYGEPEDASWQRSLDQSEDAAATVVHI